ncbi:MAG: hypothetical protein ACK5OW_01550 [bacterium]|jgi:hypothetical protein
MKKENHKKDLSQQKEELYKKWENTGIFDNLRGGLKENISKLYECCASSIILSGDTKK